MTDEQFEIAVAEMEAELRAIQRVGGMMKTKANEPNRCNLCRRRCEFSTANGDKDEPVLLKTLLPEVMRTIRKRMKNRGGNDT